MTDKIGPREAADLIRDEFTNEHLDPQFHHQVVFSGKILDHLGEEKTPENVAKVMRLLGKHGIDGAAYVEYPAWVQNDRGERAVVLDDDHKAAFMARPEPVGSDGNPNPEHGHVDPQTGVFTAGAKPVEYTDEAPFDHDEGDPPPDEPPSLVMTPAAPASPAVDAKP